MLEAELAEEAVGDGCTIRVGDDIEVARRRPADGRARGAGPLGAAPLGADVARVRGGVGGEHLADPADEVPN